MIRPFSDRVTGVLAAALICGVAAGLAPRATAAEGAQALSRGVPGDAFVFQAWASNPERAFMNEYNARVWKAFEESGIMADVHAMVQEMVPAEARQQAEGPMKQALGLINSVDWAALVEQNGCWAMVMGPQGPESVTMFVVDAKKLPKIYEGLGNILDMASGMVPIATRVKEAPEEGQKGHRIDGLDFGGTGQGPFMATHGNTLLFSGSKGLLKKSLALLDTESGEGSLSKSRRLTAALGKVPTPEDQLMFFDTTKMFDLVFATVRSQLPPPPQDPEQRNEEIEQVREILSLVEREAGALDYVVSSGSTEGYRLLTSTHVQYKQSAGDKLMYRLLSNQAAIDGFHRMIPKDASSFSISSGIDLLTMFNFAMEVVEKYVPDGAEAIAQFKAQQQQMGLDIAGDILAHIRGDMVSVAVPGVTPNPFGGSGNTSVSMVGLKDSGDLVKLVSGAMERGSKMIAQQGIPVTLRPVQVAEGGKFWAIQAAMMPFVQPVIGFHQDRLFFGADAGAIDRILSLANNPDDTILNNDRFKAVGLVPDRPVHAIAYKNLEAQYRQLAQGLGQAGMMIGMMSGMMAAQMPEESAAEREMMMKVISKVTEILPKLAPVIAEIDYYQDQVSFSYLDRDTKSFVTKKAVTIRPPKKADGAESAEGEAKAGDAQ